MPLGSQALNLYRIMCNQGLANKDFSAAFKFLQKEQKWFHCNICLFTMTCWGANNWKNNGWISLRSVLIIILFESTNATVSVISVFPPWRLFLTCVFLSKSSVTFFKIIRSFYFFRRVTKLKSLHRICAGLTPRLLSKKLSSAKSALKAKNFWRKKMEAQIFLRNFSFKCSFWRSFNSHFLSRKFFTSTKSCDYQYCYFTPVARPFRLEQLNGTQDM